MNRLRLAAAISLAVASQFALAATPQSVQPRLSTPEVLTDATLANAHLLLLRAGLIDPTQQRINFSGTGAAADVASSRYALFQFEASDRDARARLERLGYIIVGYVPNHAYIVDLGDARDLAQLTGRAGGRWAGYFQPGMKLEPTLYADQRASLVEAPLGGYDIQVFGFKGHSARQIGDALSKLSGATVTVVGENADLPNVRFNVTIDKLDRLIEAATAFEGVSFVGHYAQPYLHNSASIGAIQGNNTSTSGSGSGAPTTPTPMFDHLIFGSGQIVAISDSGTDPNEAWFTTLDKGSGPVTAVAPAESPVPPAITAPNATRKILNYYVQPGSTYGDNNSTCPGGFPTGYHGTHTSGSVAGDVAGTFGPTYLASTPTALNHELADGMAPNAQLLVQDIGNDTTGCLQGGPINDMFTQATRSGAFIHSASWGAGTGGAYSANDAIADRGLRDNEGLLFVVSAGNDGAASNTIGTPGNAKSAVTVGALDHAGALTIAGFSSRGPTDDGRVKPDIVAPGVNIVSALGNSISAGPTIAPLTQSISGTSMSTPTVAGGAALMRQFFTEGWYPRGTKTAADAYTPTGAVMKAALLNGTNPISTNFGTNTFGWGRIWLDGNLFFASTLTGGNDSRRLRLFERTQLSGIKTGETHSYAIQNVAAGQQFRATLAWFDVPGTPGAAIALVNNLDLEVIAPNGTYLGNVLFSGASTTGGTADVRNTVEQVQLTAPVAGTYTIRVKGTNVPGDGSANSTLQGYGLAVSGAFGLPAVAAHPAPTATTATTVGNTTQVAFTGAGGASSYQLYRSNQSCASSAPGDFHLVGTGAASPLVDTTAQGGFQYGYKIRGVAGDVEGDVSNCVDITSTAACTLQPTFAPKTTQITATEGANCHVALSWQPGTSACPAAPMGYRIERDTSLAFTGPTVLAAAHPTATYDDTTPNPNTPYFYRVQGRDAAGNVGGTSPILASTGVGAGGIGSKYYVDNADSRIYLLTQDPWHLSSLTTSPGGGRNYFMGNEVGTYAGDLCTAITTPTIAVQAGWSTLGFNARYDIEHNWDGVVMQVSTNGGTTWADLPPDGGYPSSFVDTQGNGCNFPPSQGAFNGVTTAASNANPNNGLVPAVYKPFTRNMSSFVGQNVKIRWIFSADSAAEFQGFFLDDVSFRADVVFADDFEAMTPANCN